jgi:hypothetical protein
MGGGLPRTSTTGCALSSVNQAQRLAASLKGYLRIWCHRVAPRAEEERRGRGAGCLSMDCSLAPNLDSTNQGPMGSSTLQGASPLTTSS